MAACLKGVDKILDYKDKLKGTIPFNEFLSKDEELEAAAKNLLYKINHELDFDRQVWLVDSEYEEIVSAY